MDGGGGVPVGLEALKSGSGILSSACPQEEPGLRVTAT